MNIAETGEEQYESSKQKRLRAMRVVKGRTQSLIDPGNAKEKAVS
jgi:hypothetical protein